MIRTKDLFLFTACLLFLTVAVFATITATNKPTVSDEVVIFSESVVEVDGVEMAVASSNRTDFIADLKKRLAADTSTIIPQASVTSGDIGDIEVAATTTATMFTSTADLNRCVFSDDVIPYLSLWPVSGVVAEVGTALRTYYSETSTVVLVDSTGTSTATTTELVRTTYLTVPVRPNKLATASCVPSEVIGVTTAGALLFNTNAAIYAGVSESILIGYARDGFPIYGATSEPLDVCGGYDAAMGYRYAIAPDRAQILTCFTGAPQPFQF